MSERVCNADNLSFPVFERNGDTVYFKTERNVYCPSPVAQKQAGVQHRDVCAIHKRAFMEGVAKVLEKFHAVSP